MVTLNTNAEIHPDFYLLLSLSPFYMFLTFYLCPPTLSLCQGDLPLEEPKPLRVLLSQKDP